MGSSNVVSSVETSSGGLSIPPDPCGDEELRGGTGVAKLPVNAGLARPFSASLADGGSTSIGMVGE